jgi:2-dehydro-3-deoxygluconokinase
MTKIVTFGEIMLRLATPGFLRFSQATEFEATFGGGEANVAVSLAHFGLDSWYVTRLPRNAIGDAAIRALRAEGVQVGAVVRGGERVGIYFAETGASQRASTVVYDRAHSSISEMTVDDVAWSTVMAGAGWLHITCITPALGHRAAECTRVAIDAARSSGATVSIDLNYRRKLWTEAEARSVMRPLVKSVDVIIANEVDLQSVLGIPVAHASVASGSLDVTAYEEAARRVSREFDVPRVAITLRESRSASENGWSALLWDAGEGLLHRSQTYDLRVVDRIGGGDSFAAGLIYALVSGRPPDVALRFAVAASALKHSIPGDFNRVSVEEVDRLAAGDGSGRVQR